MAMSTQRKVAVIGAGPSGFSVLVAFAEAGESAANIKLVCFEKQAESGGLWNYTWRTGTDEYGEAVHGSMYHHLWSNGPKEALEFANYSLAEHFGKPTPSFPPRAVLRNYLLARARRYDDIETHIQLNTAVTQVKPIGTHFEITTRHLPSEKTETQLFDFVVNASGHFSVPQVPSFPGLCEFTGRVLHSHDFRDANQFKGQRLLFIGASYSAEDIALQCLKFGASSATICHRTKPMGFKGWPDSVVERGLPSHFSAKHAHFNDGSSLEVDSVFLCTGYLHHYPYMQASLRLRDRNRLWLADLYKSVVWINNPRLFYIGAQDQYYTFSMFDAQAWYIRDVILGRISLPAKDKMQAQSTEWLRREEGLQGCLAAIEFQRDMCEDLAKDTDYPNLDWDAQAKAFMDWEEHKQADILDYRNGCYVSAVSGVKATKPRKPWFEENDDSVDAFVG